MNWDWEISEEIAPDLEYWGNIDDGRHLPLDQEETNEPTYA